MRFEILPIRDKTQAGTAAWFQERLARWVTDRLDAQTQRLEQEAFDLLDLGVPQDQITRLIHADGFQEMVPERTDWAC